ncbi:hypothetical protein HF563_05905 [Acidithiobacillus ferridurans]|nr:hypothetical protein [Acidithiobacillus ferridurans]
MATERKQIVTMRYTSAELAALDREAKTLGMTRSEYIRTLMQHGKSRLYIEYLHGLVEQINVSMREIAEQKSAPQTPEISSSDASTSPDVLQRILHGMKVLHAEMKHVEAKVEHIEAYTDAQAIVGFGSDALHRYGVDGQAIQKPATEVFCRKWNKEQAAKS